MPREPNAQMIVLGTFSAPPVWSFVAKSFRQLLGGGRGVQVLVGVLVFVAWYFATESAHLISPGRFPSPSDVWLAWHQIISGDGYAGGVLLDHILQSCRIILGGFGIAVVSGVPLGLLMGASKDFEAFFGPIFSLLRPIPPLAWIPLSILWFGLGDEAKIFIVWLSAFVPSVINSDAGIRNIDPVLIEAAKVHGASRWSLLKSVIIPGALPMIMTGMRLSLQVCWNALVAAELVGSFHGLGHLLNIASLDLYPGMILLAMAIVAVLGRLMTAALSLVEKRLFRWSERSD
jgi:ABC-type nitrate/sulfonate/bicarbonate transport system permease component